MSNDETAADGGIPVFSSTARRMAWTGLGVSAVGLAVYSVIAGPDRYVERGDPYPGQLTSLADVVGYFLVSVAGALVLGSLVFVVTVARPAGGFIDARVYPAHLMVTRASSWLAVGAWAMVLVGAADAMGTNPIRLVGEAAVGVGIAVSETAVAWIVVACCATVVAVVSRFVLSWIGHVVLLVPAFIAVVAPYMAGNAGQGPNHDYMTGLAILFAASLSVGLGYRWAFACAPELNGDDTSQSVPSRCPLIVVIADVVSWLSGAGLVAFLLPQRFVFDTAFGVAAVVFMLALSALGYVGWREHRLATRGVLGRDVRLSIAGATILALVVFAAWAVMDTRVAPRFLARRFSAFDVLLGYPLPGPPTVQRLALFWRFDVFIGTFCLVAVGLYVWGVVRLIRRGDQWSRGRTMSWILGCLALVFFTSSGVRSYGSAMFSVHMAEHMALNMFIPVLLVLGAPATLALRALPTATANGSPGPRKWVLWLLHSRITRVSSNPIVALAMFVMSLYVVYFTSIFATFAKYHWGHVLLTVHFVIVGYLFFWVILGIDPGPRRLPFLARIGLLFAVMPFHAFFGIALMTMTTVIAGNFYSELALPWVSDLSRDQWLGGAIAWGASELPVLMVVVAIVVQWAKSDRRQAARADRHADTYEDDELSSYNEMLAALARSRR
ncbi:cytochrome c oxidase assembly protein [Gordonia crocea]|uniref:ABC transporter permease n=1 Tax=Gordonia crocea TaxID=589162 RepID=A0A7I9V0F7_9ACTN|nr:cytochrome c oxidase assembly protein [Gordonia crocea]GED98550.1 hypothetical protein nbrc107697_25890 [Gordonia crocea]